MLPKHTEPLFILAADGLLRGRDPEGTKNQALFFLAHFSFTAWFQKSRKMNNEHL